MGPLGPHAAAQPPLRALVTYQMNAPQPPGQGGPEDRLALSPGKGLPVQTAPTTVPEVRSATLISTPFSKFLKYRHFELEVQRNGKTEKLDVPLVNGPGHDVAAVASFVLDGDGQPHVLMKSGDTRIARVLRGDDYVKIGSVAGRLDKVGADFKKIGIAELTEEVGGEVVNHSLRRLGDPLSPTMPNESVESDASFMALVRLAGKPTGDGGGMELTGLIGPLFLSPQEAWQKIDSGEVSDAGRVQMTFGRAFDAMGYCRELGVFVQDHPRLAERFDSLGLGPAVDPRGQAPPSEIPPNPEPDHSLESQVNNGIYTECQTVDLGNGVAMLDGKTVHAVAGTPVGAAFPNQLLTLKYDRAKVLQFVQTPEGPLVKMALSERPALALRALALKEECTEPGSPSDWLRRDVDDVKVDRNRPVTEQIQQRYGEEAVQLGSPTTASSGQCDLKYSYVAVPGRGGEDYMPLASALRACRDGQGDAQTEAALLRLAEHLHWIPELNLSVEDARKLLS